MLKQVCIVPLLLLMFTLSSQTTRAIKAFVAAGYTDVGSSSLLLRDTQGTIVHADLQNGADWTPGIGFTWSRGGNITNELELAEFINTNKPPRLVYGSSGALDNERFPKKNFQIRIRHGIRFDKGPNSGRKLGWSIGGGYSLFYRAYSVDPTLGSFYKIESKFGGVCLDINPAIRWNLFSNWQLELSAPVTLGTFGHEYLRIYNPLLTERQQKNGLFDLDIGVSAAWLRLGILYKLPVKSAEE